MTAVPGLCETHVALQVQTIMKRLNFNHTNYGFCKNLTEHMLAGYHLKPFPVCISRPVSVGCVAKGPCPGYVGNTSGATGIILSIACGKCVCTNRMSSRKRTLSRLLFA